MLRLGEPVYKVVSGEGGWANRSNGVYLHGPMWASTDLVGKAARTTHSRLGLPATSKYSPQRRPLLTTSS